MARAQRPQRGEIWTVQFDPSVGAEIRKHRPAVVCNLNAIGRLPLRMALLNNPFKSGVICGGMDPPVHLKERFHDSNDHNVLQDHKLERL
jgi:hypothetical protein